jgi:hypothetical protein
MDIANELKAHLEDSFEEYRQAGYGDDEAAATAIKALGDETDLAKQLWIANRRRLRVRQVIKWSARIALIPLSIVMIFLGLVPLNHIKQKAYTMFNNDGIVPIAQSLSEEQRFIFYGDPQCKTDVEKQKSISDRWPENPIYYGNYVTYLLGTLKGEKNGKISSYQDPAKALEVLPILSKGQQLEPDNSFYSIAKAAILINTSCVLKEDPKLSYAIRRWDGKDQTGTCQRITITNPERFQQGVNEFQRGLCQPIYNSHAVDMMKLRLGLLPPIDSFEDYLSRSSNSIAILLPDLGQMRQVARVLCAYSLELAQQGKKQEVEKMLKLVSCFGSKIGSDTEILIQLLVGEAIYQLPFGYGIYVYQFLNLPEESAASKSRLQHEVNFADSILIPPESEKQKRNKIWNMQAGTLDRAMLSSAGEEEKYWNFRPMRGIDYVLYSRLGMTVIFLVLVALSLLFVLITGVNLLRLRKNKEGPKLIFVGWRPMIKITLIAVVIPIIAYMLYIYGFPPAEKYALMYAKARLGVEFFLLGAMILVLALTMSYSAIRRRAMEAGIIVPPEITMRNRQWSLIFGMLAIATIIGFVIYWYLHAETSANSFISFACQRNMLIFDGRFSEASCRFFRSW